MSAIDPKEVPAVGELAFFPEDVVPVIPAQTTKTVFIPRDQFEKALQTIFDPGKRAERFRLWKAGMRISTEKQKGRWPRAQALVDAGYPCSGVSAGWCPNCGDCTCPPDPETDDYPDGMNHPDCPLHSPESPHPTGAVE
ncbi:MAG: hypothetical protein K0U16_07680 [Gammaproteobacteria bacterium]|nr:hypothetical protein [Gammaproteobacteria bacterium]